MRRFYQLIIALITRIIVLITLHCISCSYIVGCGERGQVWQERREPVVSARGM